MKLPVKIAALIEDAHVRCSLLENHYQGLGDPPDDIEIAKSLRSVMAWNRGEIDAKLNPITKKTGANLVRYSDQDIESARYMLKLIESKFFTMTRQPDLEKWAEDIRKMREIDGHTGEEIAELFTWAHNDSFWSTNIRSPSKLRKQWDTLKVRMQNGNTGRNEYL